MESKPIIVGITGGSGSGKTKLIYSALSDLSSDKYTILSQDNYYHPRDKQPVDTNGIPNFDTPQSLDFAKFQQDLLKLISGQPLQLTEYGFNNPNAPRKIIQLNPAPLIIVEGLFIPGSKEVKEILEHLIFIDVTDEMRLKRRIKRDNLERGYELEDVLYRFEHHVLPSHNKYVEPVKKMATSIIDNSGKFDLSVQQLKSIINTSINF